MNLKYALLDLYRKPIFTILTILQLVAACTLLYESYSYKVYYSSRIEKMIQGFENKNLYYIKQTTREPDLMSLDSKKLEGLSNYLKNTHEFKYISEIYDHMSVGIGNKNGNFIMAYQPQTVDNVTYQMVYRLDVDSNFFKKFGFKVTSGRIFNDSDFNAGSNGALPVILGDAYSGMYKVGDIIKSLDSADKIQVIGFLDKGYYFSLPGNDSMLNLDNYIITPQQPIVLQVSNNTDQTEDNEIRYKIKLNNYCLNGYLEINETDKSEFNKISGSIISEAGKAGYTVKIAGLNDDVQDFITSAKKQENSINIMFLVIFCFTSVGIITSVLYSISKQLKEFGVHIMQGAVISDIARRVLYQILILFGVAFIGTFIVAATIINDKVVVTFSIFKLFIVFCVFMILALLVAVIPVIKVLRLSINDLVRGEE